MCPLEIIARIAMYTQYSVALQITMITHMTSGVVITKYYSCEKNNST